MFIGHFVSKQLGGIQSTLKEKEVELLFKKLKNLARHIILTTECGSKWQNGFKVASTYCWICVTRNSGCPGGKCGVLTSNWYIYRDSRWTVTTEVRFTSSTETAKVPAAWFTQGAIWFSVSLTLWQDEADYGPTSSTTWVTASPYTVCSPTVKRDKRMAWNKGPQHDLNQGCCVYFVCVWLENQMKDNKHNFQKSIIIIFGSSVVDH